MYRSVLHFLRGSVWLTVDCPMPERIMNLCAAHDIPFWDVRWESPSRFSLRTSRWGYVRLRAAARDVDAALTLRREDGAPLLLRRVRRRYVLLGAAAVFAALLWYGSTTVWAIEITGNDTVPAEKILRALEKQGVAVGTRALSIDQETLRNHLLLELKDVSWLAVNVSGCTAHVQVVERRRPPRLMADSDKENVVAAKDGLVTKVEALDGKAQVLPGDTVTKGQLLISGVVDSPMTGVRLLHGMGRVYARTWYELSAAVPLTARQHGPAGRSWTHFSLIFGKHRINFFGKGSVLGESCDKMTAYRPLALPFGFRLPVTLVTERWVPCRDGAAERSAEAARQEGEAALLRQLEALLGEEAEIVSTRFSAVERNGWLWVTLHSECHEQIGVSVPIG